MFSLANLAKENFGLALTQYIYIDEASTIACDR